MISLQGSPPTPRPVRAPGLRRARRAVGRAGLVAALVLAVAGPTVLAWSAPSAAQDPLDCEIPVVDSSGEIDVARVEAAIDGIDLDRLGPDAFVAVRVWSQVADADLVAAVDELVAICFGDIEDGIADDVAVIGLSIDDGLSDVLLGAGWGLAVPDADRLRAEVMGPRLSAGDLTGGLVAAIDEMAVGVAALPEPEPDQPTSDATELPGASASASGDEAPAADEGGAITSEPAADDETVDIDDGGSPWALALGAIGLAGCGGVVALVQRQRSLAAERDRLRRRVEPTLGRLQLLRERHHRVLDRADLWNQTAAGRTRTEITTGVRRVESAGRDSDRANGLLQQAIPDGVDRASREQAARGRERAAELVTAMEAHVEVLDELAALGAHLDHLEVALPAKADVLAHEIPEARELANRRAEEGWDVDEVRTELSAIQAVVAEAEESETTLEVDRLALSDELEEAEARLFAVDHRLQSLPDREPSLKRWERQLAEAADHELHRVDELRRQLAGVALVHAPRSWRWAANHPEQAVEALERSDELRQQAIEEQLPAQRFDDAGLTLDRAGLELIRADDVLDEVDDLLVDLERARVDAPEVLGQLDREIQQLSAAVDRHRADLSPELLARHQELVALLVQLRIELDRPKPDHLEVVETGEQAAGDTARLRREAGEQYREAEALRGELERQRARATRALARARRSLGWQLFPSGDGAALDRLEVELGKLPSDLPAAVAAARDIADAALRIQEQIIARRRRRGVSVSVGSGGSILGGSGGSRRSSRSSRSRSSRSQGGRSFGGRSRSRGGRSRGSRRSSGRF